MALRPSPCLEGHVLHTLDALVKGKDVRVLLVGDAPKGLEAELSSRATSLTRVPSVDNVQVPGEFDAAVVVGRLEHERWDRWEAQRLHALLRPGGTLVLAVPNFASVWSVSGLAFIGGRIIRELRLRLARRSALPKPETGPFRGRRYRASNLRTMLEGVGFEIRVRAAAGNGLYRAAARISPRVAQTTGRHFIVGARRLPSLWTADAQRPFPDADSHRRDFESAHAHHVRVRDAWASRHPQLAGPPATPLDAAAHAGASVLVLAPHPDDEIIGCGGTLRRLIAAGARVTLLHATDGSDSAAFTDTPEPIRTTVRLKEAARVAASLGVEDTTYWKLDNRNFHVGTEHVEALAGMLARAAPRIVFVPFVTDIHPDHFVLSRALAAALPMSGLDLASIDVFNYEVWSLVPANVVSDVTDLMPFIERLLLLYETALKVDDYVHLCANRMYYNALRYMDRKGYADAFLAVRASEYTTILREQEREPLRLR